MPGLLFPQQNLFNAAYEQVVIILLRIHVFIDGFVKEAAWVNLLTGHLFADKNQPRLLIVGAAWSKQTVKPVSLSLSTSLPEWEPQYANAE